jgi:PAP_fibrillin
MTTHGYVLPNPDNGDRLTVWFTGGSIEVISDLAQWKKVFDSKNQPKGTMGANVKRFAAKMLLGAHPANAMEEDRKLTYEFTRPIGGHEKAYVDLIYLDDTLRITRANTGAIFVFARIPFFPDQ